MKKLTKLLIVFAAVAIAATGLGTVSGEAQEMRYTPRTTAGGAWISPENQMQRAILEDLGVDKYWLGYAPVGTTIIDNHQNFESGSSNTTVNTTATLGDGSNFTLMPVQDHSSTTNSTFEAGSSQVDIGVESNFGDHGSLVVETHN